MSDYLEVEGRSDLVRDTYSRAIINTDKGAYEAVLAKRKLALQKNKEITELRNDVSELKDLVHKLIDKMEDNNG